MLKSYLLVALRNLRRYKAYSFINVSGLAVGMACCLLIFLFVRDELRYDRFHEHADDIYRVLLGEEIEVTPTIVAPLFKREFPEVIEAARLYDVGRSRPVVLGYGDKVFQENLFMYADSTVFDVFTMPFVAGDPETALRRTNTIVLTASMAEKYFGNADPMGEMLSLNGSTLYEVTGVMADLPTTSHLRFGFLASFASVHWAEREIWDSANFYTYLRLHDGQAAPGLQAKIDALIDRVRAEGTVGNQYALNLQPLTGIYLRFEGRITYVYLFSAIGLLVLLIACVNYMNLATARSARRAREVGIRKVAGAYRGQLIGQFYGESALLTFFALALAMLLAEAALPLFNSVSGKALAIRYAEEPTLLLALVGIGVVVSVVAGSYPALLLSAFRPAQVLKGSFRASTGAARFRKGLVIFQFAVSIFLMVGALIVYRQLDFVRTQNLGFDKEQMVVLSMDRQLREIAPTLKGEVLQHANVLQAATVNSIPGFQRGGYSLTIEGLEMPEGEFFPIRGVPTDKDIVETLGLELMAGPGFPKTEGYTPENGYVYLVNEATLRELGWTAEEAVGKRMSLSANREGRLVGVIKDYHYASLHEEIGPLAFFIEPWAVNYLMIRIAPEDVPGTLAFLRQTWGRLAAHRPFEYRFLDQAFDALYRSEEQMGRIFGVFAGLAILIACLGLFGLASFAAEQRTKEIGVRKVLGASVTQVVGLLSKEFTGLVLVAYLIALPLAYLAMHRWLTAFAYQVDLSWTLFLFVGLAALLIAFLTVSYQALKAALADPVHALRHE